MMLLEALLCSGAILLIVAAVAIVTVTGLERLGAGRHE